MWSRLACGSWTFKILKSAKSLANAIAIGSWVTGMLETWELKSPRNPSLNLYWQVHCFTRIYIVVLGMMESQPSSLTRDRSWRVWDQLARLHTYKKFVVPLLAFIIQWPRPFCIYLENTVRHERPCQVVLNLEGLMYVNSKFNLMLNCNMYTMIVVSIDDDLWSFL